VEGRIAAVDVAQGTVTLQQDGSALVMRVDAGTTIFLAGRTGRLADLVAGQRVRAAYEPGPDGRWPVAQWIELTGTP
jgi:antitoxin (DNA-binding transcriptional repressor) of toxin-antitoxin stability system